MKGERIYIAGPYQPKNCNLHDASRVAQHNVDRFIETFHRLKEKGAYPFVPTMSHYIHIHPSSKEDYGEWWYEYDLTFLDEWADAIYMLDGWEKSKGAKAELKRAKENNLKIYYE